MPRRDATALKPPRFPILTFDEWQLSLAPGSVFDLKWLMPGESLVSILWKFACANALPGHVLIHLLSPDIDPSEGLAPVRDDIDLTRLCRIVRLPQNVLRVSLLDAALPGRYHPAFRYCRLCTAHGYHSVLHQLEDEHRCPAHQQLLETRCPQCRGETPYIVNTSVIEAPFRCVRCHSHFSYGRLSLRSTTPAMRRQDRIAIRRRLLLRSRNYPDAGRC
ncbi:hypothetical protein LJR267_009663 [Paraburkholderia hospita]|uniref:TniQ protein n=1 Tax=Paraburkholderia hospita TaxID=169430 RepID=A0ABN0FTF5_9BURK|nr:hypothetical protein [Paraburkholderia hospita]EIN02047.1 hypothetical protein WQE_05902 [Paraburkholderia hospita]OUL92231.1 hypothetical protein CA602_03670 [Paraburkholderia hospita]